ncbi:Mannosylglycerate hydrolase [Paenibacillus konkukensis]|uniref:Mannosylglycerate hydrolase n=1 Tax=Paenibacillus konkukensis TaxID=2020716 RepID=A0ABY4RMQ8_9BACL|nr:glycoside hydrolase family 38 C-terminal domain-containing protein [Paenibacillus konkukensis]UQZ82954.1 Mannosylglycerate hydrolase [Paenibacillus konkukensis]
MKTAHIISHTHWDREWYLPFETHRHLLVKLMDTLMDTLERDPEFRSFHLDGQTIILDDYLAIRPDRKERLARHIAEGRIVIGPWYVLQDEFLTSSEANVRNLQYGHRDAAKYGALCKIGYFPDSFGNMGQAPQLLLQAGIDTAVFGRGVTPTGFNNTVGEPGEYESPYSEMMWQSPDGSGVLGILFANWYCNGMEVPTDPEAAKAYWDAKLSGAGKYASTPHLLFMNGCDHQPVQTDLSEAIRTAEKLYPDVSFVHSNFEDYVKAVKESLPADLSVIRGELRSQRTAGWYTLVNTASSRIYLKQMNHRVQTLLEKVAEPLAAFASSLGHPYPGHWLEYGWKTLMQNHPHDSICGCSVDEVHREMVTRFEKSGQVAENIVGDSLQAIVSHVDTSKFAEYGDGGAHPFVVFNTSGWVRSGTVSVELTIERKYFSAGAPDRLARELKAKPLPAGSLVDDRGAAVPHTLEDLGVQFGYDLPEDRFRQPYMGRKIRLTFHASGVPSLGYRSFAWVTGISAAVASGSGCEPVAASGRGLENRYLKVEIENDGSLTVTEKTSGLVFAGLGILEDTGDVGNEYIYKQTADGATVTTKGQAADIRLIEDAGYRASFEIVHRMDIPVSADERLQTEIEEMTPFTMREAGRSQETVRMDIRVTVRLEAEGRGVLVSAAFDNKAKDHRLRMLVPTDAVTAVHRADSIFEVAQRDTEPAAEWNNPSNCQHQHAFAGVYDDARGMTVANHGLQEYEVLRDGRSTIAVTLLRSTAELGDWGVFHTPEAQCLRACTAELCLIPHAGGGEEHAYAAYEEAYRYQIPWQTVQTEAAAGTLPSVHSFFEWSGKAMAFSSLKLSEESGDWMVRWFNMSGSERNLRCLASGANGFYKSGVLEDRREAIEVEGSAASLAVRGSEIVTLGVSFA